MHMLFMFLSGFALPETNSSHLQMDGWETIKFPFGMAQPGRCELLVSGRVSLFTKLILQERLECCQVLPTK